MLHAGRQDGGGRDHKEAQSQNKDLPYRPKGEPKIAPRSSPYATRQLNGAEVEPEPERVQSEVRGNIQQPVGEIAEERDHSEEEEELIKESECTEKDEMSSDLVTFLKAMAERDQRRQEELDRERVEAAKREQAFRIEMAKEQEKLRAAEAEARRKEMREMFQQVGEREESRSNRLRAEDADRRGDEERRQADRRAEEELKREKKEELRDKLSGLGTFRDSGDLVWYLEKFERVMRECKVGEGDWLDKLFSRLSERLCSRVSALKDDGADYDTVKSALMKAVGETTTTYGYRIFGMTGESVKTQTGDEIVDQIVRNCRGLFQDARCVEDCVFTLV